MLPLASGLRGSSPSALWDQSACLCSSWVSIVISMAQGKTLSSNGLKELGQGHSAWKELGFQSWPANSTVHSVIHGTVYSRPHVESVKQGICRVNEGAPRSCKLCSFSMFTSSTGSCRPLPLGLHPSIYTFLLFASDLHKNVRMRVVYW